MFNNSNTYNDDYQEDDYQSDDNSYDNDNDNDENDNDNDNDNDEEPIDNQYANNTSKPRPISKRYIIAHILPDILENVYRLQENLPINHFIKVNI